MGCVDSKQTQDESTLPYSKPRKRKRSWLKRRRKNVCKDDFTSIEISEESNCKETTRQINSHTEFSKDPNRYDANKSPEQCLECYGDGKRTKKTKSQTQYLRPHNGNEDDKSSVSSDKYWDCYTEFFKEREKARNAGIQENKTKCERLFVDMSTKDRGNYRSVTISDSDEDEKSSMASSTYCDCTAEVPDGKKPKQNPEYPVTKESNAPPGENTTMSDSLSVTLRKKGNESYTSVTNRLGTTVRSVRLYKAADCYCRAFQAATKDEESVPAAKNAAMAHWRLAETVIQEQSTAHKVVQHYKTAFRFFSFAYNNGVLCNTKAWRTKLESSIDSCWLDFTKTTDKHFDLENRIDMYYNILQIVEIDYIRGNFYLNLARFHFRNGVTAIQNGHYQRGLSEMNNCSMPVHEARKNCLDAKNVGLECDTLEDDVIMHTCTADAMQAIAVGDKVFEQTIKEDEKVNMDMIWEVIDWYKVAILRTRERTEMEQEAIAASRIGKVYDKVLMMKDKAKEYLMRSIQLAHSMHPRTFTSDDWFKDASAILKNYQEENQAKEDEEWQKQKEELKKEMKEQLDELEQADKKRDLEFLDCLYKKFPPKNPLHKELFELPSKPEDIDHCNTKKLYQKAVVNYHPDRANVEDNGVKWKVMTEEITKLLTRRYNRMKGE